MKLFVGNLSYSYVTEKDLFALFAAYSPSGVHLMRRDDGRSRGTCFIFLPDENAQQAINEMDGREFHGRRLMVSVARHQGKTPEDKQYGIFNQAKSE
jgi:RNA recognition motif-containing protein